VLFVLTAGVFLRTGSFGFTNYDDGQYVYENTHVNTGLSWADVCWDFQALNGDVSYWHPLTWLSHQLDCQLFGLRSGAHHLTSVWIHVASTLLAFHLATQLGLCTRWAFFVGGIFGVHPLHVESVAWIAERKDVLYGFFWLCAFATYIQWRRRQGFLYYVASILSFACALTSKPTAVTLPIVLTLFEWLMHPRAERRSEMHPAVYSAWPWVILRTMPFYVLSFAGCVLALVAQFEIGAVQSLSALPLGARITNAVTSYVVYLRKTIFPFDLCASYLATGPQTATTVLFSMLVLVAVSWCAIYFRKGHPMILFGWLWFLSSLIPNIGIVQVGAQSMADRYMYLPIVGLTLALVGVLEFVGADIRRRHLCCDVTICSVMLVCAVASTTQLRYWKNGVTLFSRAVDLNPLNWLAQMGLGMALTEQERYPEAWPHLMAALALPGNPAQAHRSLGTWFSRQAEVTDAVAEFARAAALEPHSGLNFLLAAEMESQAGWSVEAVRLAKHAALLARAQNRVELVRRAELLVQDYQRRTFIPKPQDGNGTSHRITCPMLPHSDLEPER
jgi:hypothetical protein